MELNGNPSRKCPSGPQRPNAVFGYLHQLQIGFDNRVEMQIPPSHHRKSILRLEGEGLADERKDTRAYNKYMERAIKSEMRLFH
jgi:hypothetical protein